MKGWTIPFFPMRPANGPKLTKTLALEILEKMETKRYVYQPKLNGDRALLAYVDKRIIVCNRHYGWYQFQIANAGAWIKALDSGSLLDGEVWRSNFYPFECLAEGGRSLKHNTMEEREIFAMQLCRLAKVEWMFKAPTKKFLLEPRVPFEGVVRKRADLPYLMLPNASGISSGWLKHRW